MLKQKIELARKKEKTSKTEKSPASLDTSFTSRQSFGKDTAKTSWHPGPHVVY